MIAQTILPDNFPYGSSNLTPSSARAVFFIDCDGRFDIFRLRCVVAGFIRAKFLENLEGGFRHPNPTQNLPDEELKQVINTALSKLYVYQPTSGLGLLSIVKGLPAFLSQAEHKNLTVGLICIDSISAFHHILRANDKLGEYYSQLSSSLRSLSSLFSVPVITTSWSLLAQSIKQVQGRGYLGVGLSQSHSASVNRPVWKQYFPPEWLRGVDQRIILQKREVRKFVKGILLVEAEGEREKRNDVVKRGAVIGWLENNEKREFEMFITDKGVRIS